MNKGMGKVSKLLSLLLSKWMKKKSLNDIFQTHRI